MSGVDIFAFITCIPVIIILLYVYNQDNDKEPKHLLKKMFLYGILSIGPILFLEILTDKFMSVEGETNLLRLFINAFVSIGLIEEGSKWVIVNKTIYYDKDFNHAYDAIIYCVYASLGFALIENILYVFGSNIIVGILRAVTAIPAHTSNGIIMGYYLGKAKAAEYNNDTNEAKKNMFLSLLVPIISHSIYDFIILSQLELTVVLFITFTIALIIVSFVIANKVSKIENNFDGKHYTEELGYVLPPNNYYFKNTLIYMMIISVCLIITSGMFLIHF